MDEQLRAIQERLAQVERGLAGLRDRVERLERSETPAARADAGGEVEGTQPPADAATAPQPTGGVENLFLIPSLVGRSSLVLGGAFLLRWFTESGSVSQLVGVLLGLAYALAWLLLADRAAARDRRLSGAVHALMTALIAFPLVWEATDRFQVFSPPVGAAVLVAFAAGGLAVAWRNSFRVVAWITILFVLGTGIGLLFRTKDVTAFGALLLALAAGSLVIAYGRGWRTQRWVVALVLDLVVLMLTWGHLSEERMKWLEAAPLLRLQAGLPLVYLTAFGLRLFVQGRFVTYFAVAQGLACWVIGFEGGVLTGGAEARPVFGVAALVAAALAWGAAARVHASRPRSAALAFGWFATLGVVGTAEGLRLLLPGPSSCIGWGLAAVGLAVLGLAARRVVLQAHAALLATGASAGCGLLAATVGAFAAPATAAWAPLTLSAATVLVLLLATVVTLHLAAEKTTHPAAAFVRVLLGLVVVTVLVGGTARVVAGPLAGAPGEAADPGLLAVLRTGILVVAALALAGVRRWTGRSEPAWLFYALLALGGLKLAVDDLQSGRPAMAAVSLGVYGLALVLGSQLVRRPSGRPTERPDAAEGADESADESSEAPDRPRS